jgi:hypothetical protein
MHASERTDRIVRNAIEPEPEFPAEATGGPVLPGTARSPPVVGVPDREYIRGGEG